MAVTILQISDTHLRSDPAHEHRVLGSPDDSLAATVAAIDVRPDLVVLSGDLSDDGSETALAHVRDAVASFGAPMMAIAGNHDIQAVVDTVFGPAEPLELGAWRVVPLATAVPEREDGELDPAATLDRIDGFDARPTVLVVHHPPVSPSTHTIFGLVGGPELLDGLRHRPHVRLILSGHLHQAFERPVDGLVVLGAPSTYYAMQHDGPEFHPVFDAPVGARVVVLHDDGRFSSSLIPRGPRRTLAP